MNQHNLDNPLDTENLLESWPLDPTLIPLDLRIPNGQRHVCRNPDALFRWTSRFAHALFECIKQAPPARTKEWYDGMKYQSPTMVTYSGRAAS